ncbi:MAG: response regulator transcription factor [Dehalococcoidia bacterium]
MKVLIVEDAPEIVEVISVGLETQWPEVEIVSTGLGESGVKSAKKEMPDVIILDLGLPDISGYEVLKRVREFSNVPIIILTVRADEADVFKGLEWGADDYMVKPFKQAELFSRIRALMRRATLAPAEDLLVYGQLSFDPASRVVYCRGKESHLTETEGRLLRGLVESAGEVVARPLLAIAIWGEDSVTLGQLDRQGAEAALDRHVRRLREKIERDADFPEVVITVSGGYTFVKPE